MTCDVNPPWGLGKNTCFTISSATILHSIKMLIVEKNTIMLEINSASYLGKQNLIMRLIRGIIIYIMLDFKNQNWARPLHY